MWLTNRKTFACNKPATVAMFPIFFIIFLFSYTILAISYKKNMNKTKKGKRRKRFNEMRYPVTIASLKGVFDELVNTQNKNQFTITEHNAAYAIMFINNYYY